MSGEYLPGNATVQKLKLFINETQMYLNPQTQYYYNKLYLGSIESLKSIIKR
jgi:hypothetical protein